MVWFVLFLLEHIFTYIRFIHWVMLLSLLYQSQILVEFYVHGVEIFLSAFNAVVGLREANKRRSLSWSVPGLYYTWFPIVIFLRFFCLAEFIFINTVSLMRLLILVVACSMLISSFLLYAIISLARLITLFTHLSRVPLSFSRLVMGRPTLVSV